MHKYFYLVAVVLIGLMLHGCDSPRLEPLGEGTILAFGDSLTAGVGVSKENSYPSVLGELTGLHVINSGISGETTSEGLKRLPDEIERTNPDMIILIEGGNDILRNKNPTEIKANLKKMIELAQGQGLPVIFVGIPAKSLFSSSAPIYKELAEQFQLVFDGTLIAGLQRSPSLKSDSVHFNKEGYRKMAEAIYELLVDNGAI